MRLRDWFKAPPRSKVPSRHYRRPTGYPAACSPRRPYAAQTLPVGYQNRLRRVTLAKRLSP